MRAAQLPLTLTAPEISPLRCGREWFGCEQGTDMHSCGRNPQHSGKCRCDNRFNDDQLYLPCGETHG